MLSGADVTRGPDRKQSMKKIMLVVAILGGSAGYAHAGEAYSDPSDSRARGVMHDSSSIKLQMRDADPFQLRVPGAPARSAVLPSVGGSEAPMQTANSLPRGFLDPMSVQGPGRTALTERADRNQRLPQAN